MPSWVTSLGMYEINMRNCKCPIFIGQMLKCKVTVFFETVFSGTYKNKKHNHSINCFSIFLNLFSVLSVCV